MSKRFRASVQMQFFTSCISTTMVLVLLGLVVFFGLVAQRLSDRVKENLTVTLQLDEDMTAQQINGLKKQLTAQPFVQQIDFISKQQALKTLSKEMQCDPEEFLEFNPFSPSFEMKMRPDYANTDSMKWIVRDLRKVPQVSDVYYQQRLMDGVNHTLNKISLVLLGVAVLLIVVSFSLINNTIRFSMYAHRFLIRTMQLVGASKGFIRRPYMMRTLSMGILSSFLADGLLLAGVYGLQKADSVFISIINIKILWITGVSVLAMGVFITFICSLLSINHFLRMKEKDLY